MAPDTVKFRLYITSYCHLCDDMALALWRWRERYPFEVETIDVDEDPALEERLGEHVPALYCGEREVCRYRLDDAALLQYIAPGAKADD